MKSPRVLVVTHSHPRLTRGGAEIAAASLVSGLSAEFNCATTLLGCSHSNFTDRLGTNLTQPFGANDYLYQAAPSFDYFKFANYDPKFPEVFAQLISELQPDVVHFHHYTVVGVESLGIVKRVSPRIKIILTLHEYLAICNHYGQMIKTTDNQLCESSSNIDCSRCFPQLSPRDFFLRKMYIQLFFESVDMFISPSAFLKGRYLEWGLRSDKMMVLENVPRQMAHAPATAQAASEGDIIIGLNATKRKRIRVGFFGQLSPLKGVTVLLDAAKALTRAEVHHLSIEIFGDYTNQPLDFQNVVRAAFSEAGNNVRFHGPYENARVDELMRSVDAVVVPSIWWENAPVVIQEALANQRPILCSNIGGMAEAVRPGLDGLHFDAGDSSSLADLLMEIASSPNILSNIRKTMRKPRLRSDVLRDHMNLYLDLLGWRERMATTVNQVPPVGTG